MGRKLFIAAGLIVLFAIGCGSKGPLRAPEGTVPEKIDALRGKAGKQGIDLTWPRPTRYADGKELNDLTSFLIFRKEIPKGCPECPAPFRQLATVDVEDQQKFMKRKQFGYVDQAVEPQTVYRYRVFSKVADGTLSEPSNEVEVAWRPE